MRQAEKRGETYVYVRPKEGTLLQRGIRCIKENGFGYTLKRVFSKIKGRGGKK
jgi:hypothetical protein